MKARSSTRHASSITPADFSMLCAVESSLKIWWSIKGLEALSDKACAVVGDGTQYTCEANTHEAKHKEQYMHKGQYMQILQDEVQHPGHLTWTYRVDQASILKTYLGTGGANLPFNIGYRTDALWWCATPQCTPRVQLQLRWNSRSVQCSRASCKPRPPGCVPASIPTCQCSVCSLT